MKGKLKGFEEWERNRKKLTFLKPDTMIQIWRK
jgi:hypothetical protein